ncbi:hypothetical protein TSAR_010745 [Trichomalopsis sarcophagae]|uniref:Uncharacterized protein n=1 Tax=Trichomalopsis sarcophagae TaxID=543379 RepID=A0A232EZP6_9HYME|nr:hypothetical protein TSAR_010745 [Trichomalopsis sarcophagae]
MEEVIAHEEVTAHAFIQHDIPASFTQKKVTHIREQNNVDTLNLLILDMANVKCSTGTHSDCHEMTRLMDKSYSISKSFVNKMKKFISKELDSKFTVVKHKEKIKLRGCEFSSCMDVIIPGIRADHNLNKEEKDLISALSDVICNVKKWP